MCGIAGVISTELPLWDAVNTPMAPSIRYRGRDGEGRWSDGRHALLFHSRLAIIALDDGAQPMTDSSGRYTIVFNGEIYNYVELREAYRRMGALFRTASDTEVILEGYKLKGTAVCNDLNGMFAFAIWDNRDRKLFLARDRLGKKPLYWTLLKGSFFFSSSIDAFVGLPGWSGRLMPSALALYARLGCFPDHLTVYEQVRSLPPGHHAVIGVGASSVSVEKYWSLRFPERRIANFSEAAEQYELLLTDAVKIRLRADVPVSMTFSGGVDSGTIAAIAAKRLNAQIQCYTLDYDTESDRSEETQIARLVANRLGLQWNYIHYDYHYDLLTDVTDAFRTVDQPCSQMAMAYSLRLYRAMRPHAKVVLSGGGADESFTGYVGNEALYQRDQLEKRKRWLAVMLQRVVPGGTGARLSRLFDTSAKMIVSQVDYLRGGLDGCAPDDAAVSHVESLAQEIIDAGVNTHLDLSQFMSVRYFGAAANFILPDVIGLRAQVEVRSPFLDHRVVEFAAGLSGALKVADGHDPLSVKFLPRKVYAQYVGEDVAWASKKGMAMNVRFYEAFVRDQQFREVAELAFSRLADAGLDAERPRRAWTAFINDIRQGVTSSTHAGVAMSGLMLGLWLSRQPLSS